MDDNLTVFETLNKLAAAATTLMQARIDRALAIRNRAAEIHRIPYRFDENNEVIIADLRAELQSFYDAFIKQDLSANLTPEVDDLLQAATEGLVIDFDPNKSDMAEVESICRWIESHAIPRGPADPSELTEDEQWLQDFINQPVDESLFTE